MAKIIKSMLTTVDNPFDPFDDFDNWYSFDQDKKHFSCERLAEIVPDLNDSNEVEQIRITESAINKIVSDDLTEGFIKVQRVCDIE